MNTRQLFSTAISAAAFVTVIGLAPLAVHAASYTVSTTDDELDGSAVCTTGDSTDCSLREAIDAANADVSGVATIILPAGTYTLSISTVMFSISTDNDDNNDGDLDITNTTSDVIIQGEAADTTIIDGDGSTMQERVFEVLPNVTATFDHVTIQNGRSAAAGSVDGGGIYNSGTVIVMSAIVTANENDTSGSAFGGGIYSAADSTLTIEDSIVSSNVSVQHAGGVYSEGTATITDSVITGNSASNSSSFVRGGGIFNNGTMVISGSEISENTVDSTDSNSFGAGIYNFENSSLVMTNSTIAGNTATAVADANGGGVYVYDETADVQLTLVTVADNSAEFGGGVYGVMTLTGSIIADNAASTSDDDCYATVTSGGYNIVESISSNCTGLPGANDLADTDPGLVDTMTIVSGPDYYEFSDAASSDAVNMIDTSTCEGILGDEPNDQSGRTRPGYCDSGAFEYQDDTAPVVTATEDTDVNNLVECLGAYTEQGASALDDIDEDVSSTVEASGSVDTAVLGEYSIAYTAEDLSLNIGTTTRTVTVQDTVEPELALAGESEVSLTVGDDYTDAGATATDSCDDTVTVDTDNPVDTSAAGVYTVTYTATDVSGNIGTATRTVTVLALDEEEAPTVESVTKDGATLTIIYDDESTVSFDPYESGAYQYALASDGERIVVTNGKNVRVFLGDEKVAQKKINSKKMKRKFTELKVKKLYTAKSYDGVMVVLAKNNGTATVVHIRLTADTELKKMNSGTFEIQKRKPQTIKVKASNHRFITTVGSGNSQEKSKWKVTRKGKLKRVE